MPTSPFKRLTRRMIWSTSASITLLFLTSASSLPSVVVPPAEFSLGINEALSRRAGLGLPVGHSSFAKAAGLSLSGFDPRAEHSLEATDRYLENLPFAREIRGAAQRYDVDSLLLASIVEAESSFRPDAVSNRGALGLMQLMPQHFAAEESVDPLDPEVNLGVGARYLRDLRKRYDGDLHLALAAYNAGPGTIDRYGGVPPYRETRAYVGRVLSLYSEHQREAGVSVPTNPPAAGASPLPRTDTGFGF